MRGEIDMRPGPAYPVLRFLHKYLARTKSSREEFRDPELLGGREAPRIEFTSVASGKRYEIVARPVADATDAHDH